MIVVRTTRMFSGILVEFGLILSSSPVSYGKVFCAVWNWLDMIRSVFVAIS